VLLLVLLWLWGVVGVVGCCWLVLVVVGVVYIQLASVAILVLARVSSTVTFWLSPNFFLRQCPSIG
jgi:hypothetical protein